MSLPDQVRDALPSSTSVQRPDVFSYFNYREFLDHFVIYLRTHHLYSARRFALSVGFKSPSYLKMIIDGQRNVGSEVIHRLIAALDLKKDEASFFEKLVLFNQTEIMDLKDRLYEELLSYKKFRTIRNLEAAQYEFYSRWYMPVIFEAVGHVDWTKDKEEIAKSLGITIPEIDRGLEILEKLELIERKHRTWVKRDTALETEPEATSLYIRNFHREMIQLALTKLDGIPASERDLQGLTLAMTSEDFTEFRKMLFAFIAKLNKKYSGVAKPTSIYQLSTQVFPVLKIP